MNFTKRPFRGVSDKKPLMGTAKYRSLAVLGFLLIIGIFVYLPFVSSTVFGERDAYRVAVGLIESIRADQPLANSLLYGLDKSFAYFAFLDIFSPLLRENPGLVVPIMNYANALASIVLIIPFYLLIKKHWGIISAIFANLVLMSVPVWHQTSLYGHPMVPAVTFVILGFFLIDLRSQKGQTESASIQLLALDFLVVAILSVSLMLRLDSIMTFLFIPGLLLLNRESYTNICIRSSCYIILPIFIFFATKSVVSGLNMPETNASSSFLDQLLLWHSFTRFQENLIYGNILFIKAFNPLYLLIFLLACFYFFKKKRIELLIFVLPLFIFSYLFWLPNPSPERHFIYGTISYAVAISIFLNDSYHLIRRKTQGRSYIQSVVLFCAVFLLVVSHIKDYKPPYYASGITANELNLLGRHLQDFERRDNPILVIGDVIPTLLYMQNSSDLVRVSLKNTNILNEFGVPMEIMITDNGKNTFISFGFFHLGSLAEDAINFLDGFDQYKKIDVFVDPELELDNFPVKTIQSTLLIKQ
ncbi:MAG: hypothetical protein WA902_22860 [Thermosynechococcaceae cyanobacterium]